MQVLLLQESHALAAVEETLRGHYDFVCVHSAREAFEALEHNRFELIVAQVYFEHGDVFEILKEIRSTGDTQYIPFVCFAARQTPAARHFNSIIRAAAFTFGATDFLCIDDFYENGKYDSTAILKALEKAMGHGTAV